MALASVEVSIDGRAVDVPEVLRHQCRQVSSYQFLAAVTKYSGGSVVCKENRAGPIDADDSVGCRFGYDTIAFLARGQSSLSPLALHKFADLIANRSGDAKQILVRRAQILAEEFHDTENRVPEEDGKSEAGAKATFDSSLEAG